MERRFAALFDDADGDMVLQGLHATSVSLDLTERTSAARWIVPATVHRSGLWASFTADIDPSTIAAGARLPNGLWDLHVHMGALGVTDRRRATLTPERQPGGVLPQPTAGEPVTMAAYFTKETFALCLDVGLIHNRKLRPKPAPKPAAGPGTGSGAGSAAGSAGKRGLCAGRRPQARPRRRAGSATRRAVRRLRRLVKR